MEEKVDLHYENNSVDEENVTKPKCAEVVEVESSEFSTLVEVGSYDEAYDISDFEYTQEDGTGRLIFEEHLPGWYIPPGLAELILGRLNLEELECLHSRLIALYTFYVDSHDDVHECSLSDFCASTQSYSRFEIKKPDYFHLLGHDLSAELIKQGFLSPLSGSVHSTISEPSEETLEIVGSLDDEVTSFLDHISSRKEEIDGSSDHQSRLSDISSLNSDCDTDSIPDMSEWWSNPKESPVCDAIDVAAKLNKDNAETVLDDEWERLDVEDSSDEDWEIV